MKMIKKVLRPLKFLVQRFENQHLDNESLYQQMQVQLLNQYAAFKANGVNPYNDIDQAGFRCYSQFEEDGILLFILAMIGFESRKVVELCCGAGGECMASNLILNHGFDGYLYDGDKLNIDSTQRFFANKKDCLIHKPKVEQRWITAENINELLSNSGLEGEVDLLSLDIDGNDYWLWKAIEVIRPRLCVFETHNIIPDGKCLTIKYQPDFNVWDRPLEQQDYRGASLGAMVKLSKSKGYRLIGTHKYGFNAFFLREDIAPDLFPEISIAEAQNNYKCKEEQAARWPNAKDFDWVEV